MDSDHSTIISDSEPEGYPTSSALSAGGGTAGSVFLARAMREAAKQEAMEKERHSRRRTSDERPGPSMAQEVKGKGKGKGKKEEVLVLSSGEESAEEDKKPSTSRYFAPSGSPTGSKRRRVPSPNPAGEGWPSLASISAQHRSPPRPAHSRTSSSSSSVQSVYRSPEIQRATTSGPHTSVGAVSNTRPSPAPFVSALDLLRSTPSQMEESDADEAEEVKSKRDKGMGKAKEKQKKAPRPRPTVKKQVSSAGASKSKRRSTSVSSMEVIEETPAEQDGTDGDEDDRRSVASTSSSASTSALPAPSSWKERFQFGAKSSKESLVGDVKPKLESQPSQGGGGQRKKPWEDLETMIANRPRVKPPPAAPRTTRSKVKRVVKAESLSLSDDDDEAVIVLDSTSTAFLPVPSLHTSPKRLVKKPPSSTSKPTSTLSFLPAPLSLPADDRLRALTSCVLCRASWPTTKSLSVRQTHLRTCASKQLHTAETVALLVDDEILRLAEEAEERRREREEGLSLFDRAVGKGEGANAWREVTVVGVEEVLAGADQAEWTRKTRRVQEELDQGRRKDKVDKVVKVAKEVRRERAAVAAVEAGGTVKGEEGEDGRVKDEEEEDEEDSAAFPASTGRLRPDSETSRAAVAKRANELLGRAGGTGLTQAPPRRPSFGEADEEKSSKGVEEEKEDDPAVAFSSPPRPTQSFQPSDLAVRYESEGKADVVLLASKPKPSRSKSPFLPLDDDEESGSLWKSAAGRDEDDEVVRRVVSPHLPPASPLASSPSLARSFTLHRHARTISAPSPGHQINNDGDLGIGLSPSSNRLFSSLALSSPSTSSSPGSPTRSTTTRPRARSLVHPYTPLSVHSFRSRSASPVSPTRSRGDSSAASRRRAAGSSSPRTVKAMEGLGRLGLEEGETVHAREEEDDEVGWREEVEGWMMEGGASPRSGREGEEMSRIRREGKEEEDTSEEEPLASATKRARSRNSTTTAHGHFPPSSPSPAASAPESKTRKPTVTASRRRKPAAPSSPTSPAASDDEADDFVFHSDTSLPRPPPARRSSTSKRTTTAAAAKPAPPPPLPSAANLDADLDPPGMPPYSTFILSKLQKEVAKYGFRPSKEKSVMVEQMKGVWRAMNPAASTSFASASTAAGVAGFREDDAAPAKKGRKRTKAAPAEEGEEEVVPKSKAKPRGRKKKVVEADEDGGADEADKRTPGEKLRELILADEKLYCRILRYEPIHFDEFTALVKKGGVKIAQQLLMRCLDEQSITFYTQDPTNGSRRRYK